mmetsp:Transcript_20566/g.39681  ORF Transcript_20566/g.39681 Transcript_20566/m.39681 type:complete len:359 (-) Transcript_20566:203-1279(-)|eukprot:CAMPEP_0167779236 /NCGR_PEP_ID=MMETSP0111_2-20121227/4698_1 /TAXON_ID=91324 /ORGANISM="Lotharella globosa, Strain CCCM811" /LENGTH=358 /DNA_ID=CAMNT_0007669631 /DNA_START=111 /DNA_END=1187 /DNA_ORIENTATION=-
MSNSLAVSLNVYDLAEQNQYAHQLGLGAYHTGIEINGIEWSYGHAERGTGVYPCLPGSHPNAKIRERINITIKDTLTIEEVARCLDRLRPAFMGYRYHLLYLNCNHFTEAFYFELTNERAPSYINRLAQLARCCICFMPDYMQPRPGVDSVMKWAWWKLPHLQNQQDGNDTSELELGEMSEQRMLNGSGDNARFDQSPDERKVQKDDSSDDFNPSDLLIPRSPLNDTLENNQLIRTPLGALHHNSSNSNQERSPYAQQQDNQTRQALGARNNTSSGRGGMSDHQDNHDALGDEEVFIGDDRPEVAVLDEDDDDEEEDDQLDEEEEGDDHGLQGHETEMKRVLIDTQPQGDEHGDSTHS